MWFGKHCNILLSFSLVEYHGPWLGTILPCFIPFMLAWTVAVTFTWLVKRQSLSRLLCLLSDVQICLCCTDHDLEVRRLWFKTSSFSYLFSLISCLGFAIVSIRSSPVHWCKIDIELHRIFGCPDLNEHSGEAVKRDRYLSWFHLWRSMLQM